MAAIPKRLDPTEIIKPGEQGLVVFGPSTSTEPTDAVADWPTGWKSVGLITDDGFNINVGRDYEEKNAFNVRGVVARIPRAGTFEFTFTAMQTNESTLELYYGKPPTSVTTAGNHRTDVPTLSPGTLYKWGIELPTVDGKIVRWVVPSGLVTDTSDFDVSETDLPQYQMTVSAQVSVGSTVLAYMLDNLTGITVGP